MTEEELLLSKLSLLTDQIYIWDQDRHKLCQQDREVGQHLLLADPLKLERLLQALRNQNTPVTLTSGKSAGGICTAGGRFIIAGPLDEKGTEEPNVLRERIRGINALLELYAGFELRTAEHNQPFNQEKFKEFLQKLKDNSKIPLPDLSDVLSVETPHNSYAYELGHLEGITQGNPEKALRALLSPMHGQEGRMGFTDLRHHKTAPSSMPCWPPALPSAAACRWRRPIPPPISLFWQRRCAATLRRPCCCAKPSPTALPRWCRTSETGRACT